MMQSLFSHGIDVLRKTDFYAVGIRRNAFLVAAKEVAECVSHCLSPFEYVLRFSYRHEEYRPYLIDHLLNTTLRHWDAPMRELGAQALRGICELDLSKLGPDIAERVVRIFCHLRKLLSTCHTVETYTYGRLI